MAHTSKRELNLQVPCQENSRYTWALDPPPGRNSFRIVVHCRDAQHVPSPKPRAWSSYFRAIAPVLLSIFASCRSTAAGGIWHTICTRIAHPDLPFLIL
jgi:hypothetical protein